MQNKVIVITGASAGIGASLAELVASKGASPVLLARREKMLADVASRIGKRVLVLVSDVTRRADVEHAVEASLAEYGKIDVWVNNAGRGISRMVSELTDDDFDTMMNVNVKAALHCMQAVLPHFRERGQGHIINVSSMLGRLPIAAFRSAYSASKHALNSLTANLRMELSQSFPLIHVSSVHPGVVATEFGSNALHGGMDSRQFPGAQTAAEVAAVIADLIENPRADVYTRSGAQSMVVNYYTAQDMGQAEKQPPFMNPAPRSPQPQST